MRFKIYNFFTDLACNHNAGFILLLVVCSVYFTASKHQFSTDLAKQQQLFATKSVEYESRLESLEGHLKIKSAKISLLEESLDPTNIRSAKIKQVRAAIKQTIDDSKISQAMSTPEMTTFASIVVDAAEEFDVDVSLVLAVARRESAFNPNAQSHAGAQGLMQVMPNTAREIAADLGVRHYSMFKIRDNVRFGTYYLMKLLDEFGDHPDKLSLAVLAYNAGPTYVKKVLAGEYANYPKESQLYVKIIVGNESTKGFISYYQQMGL